MALAVPGEPILRTERLDLSPPSFGDLQTLFEIVSDPETSRFLDARAGMADHFQRFFRSAGSWFLCGYGGLILRRRDTGEVIGNCGVFHNHRGLGPDFDNAPEAGWILRHDQKGQGFALEAMTAVIAWFEQEFGPQRIMCMIAAENEPSLALAGKLGFVSLREAMLPDGEVVKLLERLPDVG